MILVESMALVVEIWGIVRAKKGASPGVKVGVADRVRRHLASKRQDQVQKPRQTE